MASKAELALDDYEFQRMDPALLAGRAARNAFRMNSSLGIESSDREIVATLNEKALMLGLLQKPFWVETARAMSLPLETVSNDELPTIDASQRFEFVGEDEVPFMFDFRNAFSFEGTFAGYSKVIVGNIIGAHSVRSVCMAFNQATILPEMDSLPPKHLLHVPIMAADLVEPTRTLH